MANSIVASIVKSYKGREIRIREDEYVCLSDMATANGKLFADWHRLKTTQSYLTKLSAVTGIPITDNHAGFSLISVIQGIGVEQGTWGHRKVALRFAQWCSDDFAIQVDFWIDELLTTGKVELKKTSFESIANEKDWDKLRADGIQYRRTYTDRIKEAGGKGIDYAKATNEIYIGATGLDAKQIKQQRGIVKSKPARDALNVGELQIVAMTEWHLSEALPNGSNLGQINQASRSQAERLKSALMVF
jgi:hypothetical protein